MIMQLLIIFHINGPRYRSEFFPLSSVLVCGISKSDSERTWVIAFFADDWFLCPKETNPLHDR